MFFCRLLSARARALLVSLALLALVGAFYSVSTAPPASAQTPGCPSGQVIYGTQTCVTTGYTSCADGSLVISGSLCSSSGFQTCSPVLTTAGYACSTLTTGMTCPAGALSFNGQTCPLTYYSCPNGQVVYTGQQCASTPATCSYTQATCTTSSTTTATTSAYPSSYAVSAAVGTCPNGGTAAIGQQCPTGNAALPTTAAATASTTAARPGFGITYASGWNIIAGPTGTTVSGAGNPLYTFQASDTNYETVPAGSPLTGGQGYWANFGATTTSTIALASPATITVQLPALKWVMIGNPGDTNATVTGADTVLVYDPVGQSYRQTTQLAPGQGAWALSTNGGQATITNASQ